MYGADGLALITAAAAMTAVLVGVWLRPAATVAVLLTVVTIVLANSPPMYTALAGLAATAYLVLRHGAGWASPPTMLAAVGFTALAAIVMVVPVRAPWLPLLAPLVLLAGYVVALRPFLRDAATPTRRPQRE
jgi:hypothetical protein